jgi:hypothetical protein
MTAIVAAVTALVFVLLLVFIIGRSDDENASAFEAVVRGRTPPQVDEPPSLTSARWLVVNATTAGGLHFRVRPEIVELTEARLRDRHGIDLTHPRAPALLGDQLWAIVRPDAPPPDDRMAPGLSPAMFRSLLDRLEAL